jgi:hypothetical protein
MDRWQASTGANQAVTIARQATGDTTNLPNIQYCVRWQRNSGQTGTGGMPIVQSLESTNAIPFAGKTITYSFYARKGADFSGSIIAYLFTGTGTDQDRLDISYTGNVTAINETFTPTTTWQRFSYSVTLQSSVTEFASYFLWSPSGTAGAADYVEITGVQIDLGTYTASSAPAFRRTGSTIQGELAACQRYYYRSTDTTTADTLLNSGSASSTTEIICSVAFPVYMRTKPATLESINIRCYDNINVITPSAAVLGGSTNYVGSVIYTVTGATQFRPYRVIGNSGSSYIGFSAEL